MPLVVILFSWIQPQNNGFQIGKLKHANIIAMGLFPQMLKEGEKEKRKET